MSLEQKISAALLAAKQMERALYDEGQWFIAVGGERYPAARFIRDDRIVFVALVESDGGMQTVDLFCDNDLVGSHADVLPGGTSRCSWRMIVSSQETARV